MGAEISRSVEQMGAEEMGWEWHLGRAGVTRSGPTWLSTPLHVPCKSYIIVCQSRLSSLLLGPLQYPLIGLRLFVSPSRPRAATTAARLIFLIHCFAHLLSPSQKPQWQHVGRDKSSLSCAVVHSACPCRPCILVPCHPLHSLTQADPFILGLQDAVCPHSFLCTLAHIAPSWACPPQVLLPPPPHWPTDFSWV